MRISIREETPGDPVAIRQVNEEAIGSRLVAGGIARLRARGCPSVVVPGHPEYYSRFGFVPAARCGVRCQWDAPEDAFMLLALQPLSLDGRSGLAPYRDDFATVA